MGVKINGKDEIEDWWSPKKSELDVLIPLRRGDLETFQISECIE